MTVAPYSYIKRKCEDAVELLLNLLCANELAGVAIFKGNSNTELTTPRVEVVAHTATPEIIGNTVTGNWHVNLTIALFDHWADAVRDVHSQRLGAIEDMVMRNDLKTQLASSSIDFTLFGGVEGWMPLSEEDIPQEGELQTKINVTMAHELEKES